MFLRLIFTVAVLQASFSISNASPLEIPNAVEGKQAIFLSANPTSSLNGVQAIIPGELIRSENTETKTSTPDLLVLKVEGSQESVVTLRFRLDDQKAGEYAVWTRFSRGGATPQKFELVAGEEYSKSPGLLNFAQRPKSWDMQWLKAPGTLTIYPGDQFLDVTLSGAASEQKNLVGILLERVDNVPGGLGRNDIIWRRQTVEPSTAQDSSEKLLLLEGTNASDLNPVFQMLANAKNSHSLPELAVFNPEHAAAISRELGLAPAARIIRMGANLAVKEIWESPFPDAPDAFVSKGDEKSTVSKGSSAAVSIEPATAQLTEGRPQAWLTAGPWSGPGGLSLWGLDYEKAIQPNEGDPCIIEHFDPVWQRSWLPQLLQADHSYGKTAADIDMVWSQGTLYAHAYVYAPEAVTAVLHLSHDGVGSAVWLNGESVPVKPDWTPQAELDMSKNQKLSAAEDRTDQGAVIQVKRRPKETPRQAELRLRAGWNRLLIKYILQQDKNSSFTFTARFTDSEGTPLSQLKTAISNPEPSLISRAAAARIQPLVHTNAPFNLVYEAEPLKLTVDLGSVNYHARTSASGYALRKNAEEKLTPYFPFDGVLEIIITDYDGKEILRKTADVQIPGEADFDLGPAPARGYYAIQLTLRDKDGNLVVTYPSDGFSVIGGTKAQAGRKSDKKMAVVYYFMAKNDLYKTLYFPYMERIGIFRNIGGTISPNIDLYRDAANRGLQLSGDFWNSKDQKYLDEYVKEIGPYVDSFKSFNEIDIKPDVRGTPKSWVAKAKLHYEAVKKVSPEKTVIGASFARPGADKWFEECLRLGLADYHDVWDVHCYPQKPPVLEGTMSNSERETELGILTVMKKLGMKNTKPFWIGETAARASHGADSRRWQADTSAKMVACVLSRKDFEKIGFLIPWSYSREQCSLHDIEAGHMPTEAAYYTASALIDGFGYERLTLGKNIQAARFGPTVMLWSTDDAPQRVTVPVAKNTPLVRVDVVGRVADIDSDENGNVTLEATQSPVYILPRGQYEKLTAH